MISAKAALLHSGFSVDSPTLAIQQVREKINSSKTPLETASKIIFDTIGVKQQFTNVKTAIHVVQHIVLTFVKNESYDEVLAMSDAFKKAESIRTSDDTSWCFAKADSADKYGETSEAVIAGIETQVAVNADGSIKKGGIQVLTNELYKKHVLESEEPMTRKEFVTLLIKQLGRSKSCASTYSYNARKTNGGNFAVA